MRTFGDRLKLCRKLEGLTREQLAVLAKVHTATIGRWERDEDTPSFMTGCRLAKALHKNALFLSGLTDDPTPGTQLRPVEMDLVKSFREMTPTQQKEWAAYALDCHKIRKIAARQD
jgi:transcriptional regulator with XRE-family HTH domain